MTEKTAPSRRIEHLPLDDLTADPKNPKAHRLDVLSESVGRSMRDAGESPPEGIVVDDDGEWLVPAATGWASRTDSEAAAVLVALNRTTEVGGWVDDELLDLLDGLVAEDADGLLGLGYGEDDLNALRTMVAEADAGDGGDAPGGPGPDDFDEVDLDPETDYQCPSCGYEWDGSPR